MNNLLCRRFFPAAACVLLAIGEVAAQTSLPLSFGDALKADAKRQPQPENSRQGN